MTNFEKLYKKPLKLKENMALVKGTPKHCDHVDFDKCDFVGTNCTAISYLWLWEECYE